MPGFPNIPDLPGVPPLLRQAGQAQTVIRALTGDTNAIRSLLQSQPWGIFNAKGESVLEPDSIFAFDFHRGFQVSDFPIEGGEFASYNKVRRPYDLGLTVTKGGPLAERTLFQTKVEGLVSSLDLFTITTPENSYVNANLTDWSTRRTSESGVSMLTIDLVWRQIRIAPEADMTTERPLEAQDNGAVQPVAPTTSQTAAIQGG